MRCLRAKIWLKTVLQLELFHRCLQALNIGQRKFCVVVVVVVISSVVFYSKRTYYINSCPWRRNENRKKMHNYWFSFTQQHGMAMAWHIYNQQRCATTWNRYINGIYNIWIFVCDSICVLAHCLIRTNKQVVISSLLLSAKLSWVDVSCSQASLSAKIISTDKKLIFCPIKR